MRLGGSRATTQRQPVGVVRFGRGVRGVLPKGGRRITRWEHEGLLDDMAERVRTNPQIMKQRKQIVEHPFGTIKRSMNQGYFLMRGLPKVRTEMSLTVLAYNLKRVLNILGVERLLEVVIQRRADTLLIMVSVRINARWRQVRYRACLLMDFSHGLAPCWASHSAILDTI